MDSNGTRNPVGWGGVFYFVGLLQSVGDFKSFLYVFKKGFLDVFIRSGMLIKATEKDTEHINLSKLHLKQKNIDEI